MPPARVLRQGCGALPAGRASVVAAGDFGGFAKIVHDAADGVRVLDEDGYAMAVEDEKGEGSEDEEPAGDERDLRDEGTVLILVGDEEDEEHIDEGTHEDADAGLRHPVLHETVEETRAEKVGDHGEHKERDRKDEGKDGADAAHHGAKDGAGIVDAAHGEPVGEVNNVVGGEHVGEHGEGKEEHGAQRHFERHEPEIDV